MVAVFIARPVQGYVDSVRRAGLTDVADLALKRMALEIRTAVPNSVRVSGKFLEFIPSTGGGRYCTDTDSGCDPLNFDGSDLRFDVLGPVPAGSNGDQLIIFNTGQSSLDAYAGDSAGTNRRTLDGTPSGRSILFKTSGFTLESPSRRFQIVDGSATKGPVSFGCVNPGGSPTGNGILYRFTGYGYKPAQLTSGLGTGAKLADSIFDCSFTYDATTGTSTNGLVSLSLTLTREGESITLFSQIHVDNMP
jgi:MSHA biogenesis protein MshO